jgi:hypothetical protein
MKQEIDIQIEYIKNDIIEVKEDVKYIKENFLTKEAFLPVKNGFFGMIALVLTGFIGAIVNFFIRKP